MAVYRVGKVWHVRSPKTPYGVIRKSSGTTKRTDAVALEKKFRQKVSRRVVLGELPREYIVLMVFCSLQKNRVVCPLPHGHSVLLGFVPQRYCRIFWGCLHHNNAGKPVKKGVSSVAIVDEQELPIESKLKESGLWPLVNIVIQTFTD